MANMIHWLVLHTPLTVTELHHHSDALFPDVKRRVPFGTGTSISYKALDYRFKNTTEYSRENYNEFIKFHTEKFGTKTLIKYGIIGLCLLYILIANLINKNWKFM